MRRAQGSLTVTTVAKQDVVVIRRVPAGIASLGCLHIIFRHPAMIAKPLQPRHLLLVFPTTQNRTIKREIGGGGGSEAVEKGKIGHIY